MTGFKRNYLALVLAGTLTTQLAACGTVFYPERKGQISGRIDPVVAIANGVGLLFFVVPGVIAFAVDFATGAIYLPGGRRADLQPNVTPDSLNDSLYANTGQRIDWQQDMVLVESLDNEQQLHSLLASNSEEMARVQ
ncbi:hypothetical protein [Oceanisphaera psychrotolerans]|uniref:Uncharacterized protein n=1 Tax=Oceanisphaera psychrotolerans TaxID=1414654 RepID=A0A1J4QFA2_9GAMM|nr:hypothetical protein [Oceanisphaera psychrotolerans]OIN09216.1 hypothetical protein BFR47_02830 [Oceanisphaera psychrotolerans]